MVSHDSRPAELYITNIDMKETCLLYTHIPPKPTLWGHRYESYDRKWRQCKTHELGSLLRNSCTSIANNMEPMRDDRWPL